jgi:hypothetical protein
MVSFFLSHDHQCYRSFIYDEVHPTLAHRALQYGVEFFSLTKPPSFNYMFEVLLTFYDFFFIFKQIMNTQKAGEN